MGVYIHRIFNYKRIRESVKSASRAEKSLLCSGFRKKKGRSWLGFFDEKPFLLGLTSITLASKKWLFGLVTSSRKWKHEKDIIHPWHGPKSKLFHFRQNQFASGRPKVYSGSNYSLVWPLSFDGLWSKLTSVEVIVHPSIDNNHVN